MATHSKIVRRDSQTISEHCLNVQMTAIWTIALQGLPGVQAWLQKLLATPKASRPLS